MEFDLSDVQSYIATDYVAGDDDERSYPHRKLEEDLGIIAEMTNLTVDLGVKELQLELEDLNKLLDKLKL